MSNLRFPPEENSSRLWLWSLGSGKNARFEVLIGGASRRQSHELWTSMAWQAVAKLSLSAQVKELCWAEGRVAVGYPYSIVSLVQK